MKPSNVRELPSVCYRRAPGTSCTSVLNFAETSCVSRIMTSKNSAQSRATNWELVCLKSTIILSASAFKLLELLIVDFNACWNADSVDLMHMPCEEFIAHRFTRNLELQAQSRPDLGGLKDAYLANIYIVCVCVYIYVYIYKITYIDRYQESTLSKFVYDWNFLIML